MSVASVCLKADAKRLIMSGNPLELKLRLILGKPKIINRVMTSFIVITFKIGQSAGKEPKSAWQDMVLPQRPHGRWFSMKS